MKKSFIVFALIVACTVMIGLKPVNAHPTMDIVASNWKFTPDTITLKAGEPQDLRFTSSEGVHGVQSDELGIPQTTISPGKFTDVTVTAKTAGTYVVHCSLVCGAGHGDMKLTVKVEP